MRQKHVVKTISEVILPKKWHNNKEGLAALINLYNAGKKCQTLILTFGKSIYISFNIFVFLKLCVDRLAIYFNTEILYYTGDKNSKFTEPRIFNNINILFPLTQNYGEKMKYNFWNNYSYNDETLFKSDLENALKQYDEEYLQSYLRLNISELFINACNHSGYIENLGEYGIYFGISITDKKTRFVMANNGNFFSKELIEKLNMLYPNEYDYIKKCLEYGFSTKTESNGGLGLHIINQLAKNCYAKLLIVSGKGLFCNIYSNDTILDSRYINVNEQSEDLDSALPGNVVYIEVENDYLTIENIKKDEEEDYLSQILIKGGD